MSVPVSPTDFLMLFRDLWRLGETLRDGSVDSFRRCAKIYKRFKFADLAGGLKRLIDNHPYLQGNNILLFSNTQRDVTRALCDCFNKLREFRPHLGREYVAKKVLRAIANIRWVSQAGLLEGLFRDLNFQLAMLSPSVALLSVKPPIRILYEMPTVPRSMPRGSYFVFEDARCVIQPVYFSDIPDWDLFQQLLTERIFPERDPGHNTIKFGSYVLRNISASRDILPSSPGVKRLREVINPHDRVQMSVIAPYRDEDIKVCPGCGTDRKEVFYVEASCRQCGLLLRLYDAFDGQPDPLTRLAIDNLRRSGLRKFVSDFVDGLEQSALLAPDTKDQDLMGLIRPSVLDTREPQDLWALPTAPCRAIKHFRRIALCTPRWLSIEQHPTNEDANRRLQIAMEGARHLLAQLREVPELVPQVVWKAVGSRMGRRAEHTEEFLESLVSQYESGKGPNRLSRRIAHVLDVYKQCAQQSRYPFHPSVLRVRCLVWVFSQVLTLEAKILSGCSEALEMFGLPEQTRLKKPSLLDKALFLPLVFTPTPHIPLLVATLCARFDVASLFLTRQPPPPILGAIFCILQDSRGICFDYFLDGSLQNCNLDLPRSDLFNGGALACTEARSGWEESYRQCMESVMRSKGNDLTAASTVQSLNVWRKTMLRVWDNCAV